MNKTSAHLTSIGALIGLSALLLAPALAMAESGTIGSRPVIEVRETHKDGGTVEEGTVVPFQFEVANRGQADLEVTQVKPGCGCTVAKWDRVIKPGEHRTISAEMNTLSFHDTVTKHLTIFSNDPEHPQIDLQITAHLLPLVKITPSTVALLAVSDKAVTREFTLERSRDRPMKIMQVIPNAPYIRAATTPLPGDGRYKLTVTALPDAPLGRSNVPVVVWTDLATAPSITFIITVDRGIVTVPPLAFFGVVPRVLTAPRQSTVTIRGNSAPFHVKGVAVDDPQLSAKVETVREGAEYRVTVTYAGGWETTGMRRQTLTVTTDDPQQPVIKIPVQASLQARIARR
jgi:hypothetical protein